MKALNTLVALLVLVLVTACGQGEAKVLVLSPNGTYSTKTTFAAAVAAADTAGKTIVVTEATPVSGTVTVPSDRAVRVELGGYFSGTGGITFSGGPFEGVGYVFRNSGAVTGLKEAFPEWFGAVADDGTDDTAAIEKAAAASPNLVVRLGRYLSQNATITRRDINISGSGTLYRLTAGNILRLLGNGGSPETCVWPTIKGVTFDGGSPGNGVVGIWLENVREGTFEDINVIGLDKFTVWNGVIGCRFNRIKDLKEDYAKFCNYGFYKDGSVHVNRDADNAIIGCSLRVNIAHVHLAGSATVAVDGVTVTDNIFFHWNQPNKTHNIYIAFGYWINIANNKLFEPGLEAVKLDNCIHAAVSGNNIAWPGQRGTGAGAGIRILGTSDRSSTSPAYPAYFYNSEVTVTGNVISRPTAEGIYISDTIAFSVTGNTIIEPNTYAFGAQITALTPFTKDGIYIDGAASDGSLSGNTVGFDSNLMYRKERTYRWDVFASGTTGNITVNHSPPYEVRTTGNNNTLISDDYEYAGFYTSATGTINGLPSADNLASAWSFGGTSGAPGYGQNNSVDPTGYNTSAHTITFPDTASGTSYLQNGVAVGSGELWNTTVWMKASADIGVYLGLVLDENNNVGKEDLYHVGGVWRRYKISYTTPQAGTMQFRIQRKNQAGGATLYIWRPTSVKGAYEPMAMQRFCMPTMAPHTAYETAAPTTGWWRVGDRVINSVPTVGQPKAWKCTVAGSPGTWVSEGNL